MLVVLLAEVRCAGGGVGWLVGWLVGWFVVVGGWWLVSGVGGRPSKPDQGAEMSTQTEFWRSVGCDPC